MLGVVLFVGGCGSTGLIKPNFGGLAKLKELVSMEDLAKLKEFVSLKEFLDDDKPRTFLPGAEVRQAKSLAMGSAATKGWRIVDAAGDKLLIGRSLDAAAARELTDELVMEPWVRVKTDFNARRGGVDVVAGATMIATKVTGKEEKSMLEIEVTDRYRDELNRSLEALRQSWEQNRQRIATATGPVSAEEAAPEGERKDEGKKDEPGATADKKTDTETSSPSEPVAAPVTEKVVAPVEERLGEAGVWAYYAAYYARIRGCRRVDSGVTLEYKLPTFEVHRIRCKDRPSLVVRCNAGTCREMFRQEGE